MRQIIKAVPRVLMFLFGTHYAFAQVDHVLNQPFTAIETRTVTREGKETTETVTLARASDGSVYRVFSAKGKPDYRASIEDVPNHRILTLDPHKHTYTVEPMPTQSTKTLDDVENKIRTRQDEARERPSLNLGLDGREAHSDLGTRTEDGVTLYGWGVDQVIPRPPLRGKPQSSLIMHSETWATDSGVNMSYEFASYEEDRPDNVKRMLKEQDAVTDLKHEEPDAALFRIPDDYSLADMLPPAGSRPKPRPKSR